MSITIHDLARLAGLNPSTVSRALRNDPRVRTSTRERISALAAEHGYIPNLNARNLADGKTRMIALLMGSLEFPVEREAAVRLNEIFSRAGYTLAIFSYAPDADLLYADRLEKLTQKICDAAILFIPDDRTLTPHVRALLDSIRCPLVCLDRWFEKYPLPTVTTDNASAMRGLCDLAENAGMDGAVLNYHAGNTVSRNRCEHLRRELMQRNIPFLLPEQPDDIPAFLTLHRIRKPAVFTNNAMIFHLWFRICRKDFSQRRSTTICRTAGHGSVPSFCVFRISGKSRKPPRNRYSVSSPGFRRRTGSYTFRRWSS